MSDSHRPTQAEIVARLAKMKPGQKLYIVVHKHDSGASWALVATAHPGGPFGAVPEIESDSEYAVEEWLAQRLFDQEFEAFKDEEITCEEVDLTEIIDLDEAA